MNIDIHVVCWNEMQIVPFVVDYWKKIARRVYVYDNGSTDGTLEFLKKFDWIEVINFKTDGFNDQKHAEIKNNCWKGSDADWVWVSDFDECPYSEHFTEDIKWLEENGYSVVFPQWLDVISTTNVPEYKQGKLLHELVDGAIATRGDINKPTKVLFFKPNKVKEMNYSVGSHSCKPNGEIKMCSKLNTIHFKNLGIDYVLERYDKYRKRLSEVNRKNGWGYQYLLNDNAHKQWLAEHIKQARPIKDLLI